MYILTLCILKFVFKSWTFNKGKKHRLNIRLQWIVRLTMNWTQKSLFFLVVLFETKTLHGILPYLNSEITRLKVINLDKHILCPLCSVPYLVSHNHVDEAQLLPEEVSDDTASKVRVLRSASDGPSLPKRASHLLPVENTSYHAQTCVYVGTAPMLSKDATHNIVRVQPWPKCMFK